MSDVDPTPSTPVTLGDRLGWWRGELRTVLGSVQGLSSVSLATLQAAVAAIQGSAPNNTIEALYGRVEAVRLALGALGTTNEYLSDVVSALSALDARIDAIEATLGAGPYSSTETGNIRAILLDIAMNSGIRGVPPDGVTGGEVSSEGTATLAGLRYVLWPASSAYARTADHIYLTPSVIWDAYQVYIQTDAPDCQMLDGTDPSGSISSFAANSWVQLAGSHALGWAVNSIYSVSGYLRYVGLSDPTSFDVLANGVSVGSDFATGPWPDSTGWTHPPTGYVSPYVFVTFTRDMHLAITSFNTRGATVAEYLYNGSTYQTAIGALWERDVSAGQVLSLCGGNGQLDFHVVVS